MDSFKTFSQRFVPSPQLKEWMSHFQQMMNDFVRIGYSSGANSYSSLSDAVQQRMADYDLDPAYKASAVSRALRMLTTFQKQKHSRPATLPYCRRPMLASFKDLHLVDGTLRIPGGVILNLTEYMTKSLSAHGAPRLVVVTPEWIHVTISHFAPLQHISGMAGIDTNTDNITMVDTSGRILRYDMSRIVSIVDKSLRAKRGLHRKDARIKSALFKKYGQIERDRIGWITHDISSRITNYAKQHGLALALEDISWLRSLYTVKAGHTRAFLRRRHAWPYHEIRRQLTYKAAWLGIPVITVAAEYTSSECSRCGGRTEVRPNVSKKVTCKSCGAEMDRDENAARNILRRGLRSGLLGFASEAVSGSKMTTRPSDPGADANQPAGSAS